MSKPITMKIKAWIEATRLRTLPASVSGVVAATGYALMDGCFKAAPAVLCLMFAVLAQISSNFANEYYDFKGGLDKKGREGPRRGVTEGDITPEAMKYATFGVLALACCVGCSLIYWGGWWLLAAGMLIALGVLAYSTGPYPLSHHALGEAAVVCFFGIVPVNLTYYLQSGHFTWPVALGSLAIGLMGANILIVNNYRDRDDDAAVGKTTIAVKFGLKATSALYLINGYAAVALTLPVWLAAFADGAVTCIAIPVLYLLAHTILWTKIRRLSGHFLNPFLGMTALLMLLYSAAILIVWI